MLQLHTNLESMNKLETAAHILTRNAAQSCKQSIIHDFSYLTAILFSQPDDIITSLFLGLTLH